MSCIYGLFARKGNPDLRSILREQQDKLSTFAPDGDGQAVVGPFGLGHLLVHNTPDSLHDRQPYHAAPHDLYIVGDLRLDNREEIFQHLRLVPDPHVPDIQLALRLYQQEGKKFLERLLGDFALVIVDNVKQELIAARDPLGVKPFYYFLNKDWFAFASRIRGLWPVPGITLKMQESYVLEMLYSGYPHTKNETCYADIQRLEGGQAMIVSRDRVQTWRYWDLRYSGPIRYKREEDYIEHGRGLLDQAIAARCRTVFPLGSQLSGGLDSSGITLMANRQAKENQIPFVVLSNKLAEDLVGKEFPKRDERHYINQVIAAGTLDRVVFLDWKDKDVNFLIAQQAEINDGMGNMDYSIFSAVHGTAAASHGVRTLLSGYPGDELVTYPGYERIRELLGEFKIREAIHNLLSCNEYEGGRVKVVLRYFFRRFAPGVLTAYNWLRGNRLYGADSDNILADEFKATFRRLYDFHYNRIWKRNDRIEQSQLEINQNTFLPYRMEAERAGSWDHKVAYAYPFADVRLLDFFLNVPSEIKFKLGTTRYLYRKCMEGIVPQEVLYRRKSEVFFIIPTYFYLLKQGYPEILTMYNELLNSRYNKYINASWLKEKIEGIPEDKLSFDQTAKNALSLTKINFQ